MHLEDLKPGCDVPSGEIGCPKLRGVPECVSCLSRLNSWASRTLGFLLPNATKMVSSPWATCSSSSDDMSCDKEGILVLERYASRIFPEKCCDRRACSPSLSSSPSNTNMLCTKALASSISRLLWPIPSINVGFSTNPHHSFSRASPVSAGRTSSSALRNGPCFSEFPATFLIYKERRSS